MPVAECWAEMVQRTRPRCSIEPPNVIAIAILSSHENMSAKTSRHVRLGGAFLAVYGSDFVRETSVRNVRRIFAPVGLPRVQTIMSLNVPHPAPLLPWLDLSRLDDGRATDHLDFLIHLREAAHDVGFFYLTAHGITAKQCEEILAVARRFFDLPEPTKLEVG